MWVTDKCLIKDRKTQDFAGGGLWLQWWSSQSSSSALLASWSYLYPFTSQLLVPSVVLIQMFVGLENILTKNNPGTYMTQELVGCTGSALSSEPAYHKASGWSLTGHVEDTAVREQDRSSFLHSCWVYFPSALVPIRLLHEPVHGRTWQPINPIKESWYFFC